MKTIKLHKAMTPWGLGYRIHFRGEVGSLSVNENIGFVVKLGFNWFAITPFYVVISTANSRARAASSVISHFMQDKKEGAA
jgi:hypothetical protein